LCQHLIFISGEHVTRLNLEVDINGSFIARIKGIKISEQINDRTTVEGSIHCKLFTFNTQHLPVVRSGKGLRQVLSHSHIAQFNISVIHHTDLEGHVVSSIQVVGRTYTYALARTNYGVFEEVQWRRIVIIRCISVVIRNQFVSRRSSQCLYLVQITVELIAWFYTYTQINGSVVASFKRIDPRNEITEEITVEGSICRKLFAFNAKYFIAIGIGKYKCEIFCHPQIVEFHITVVDHTDLEGHIVGTIQVVHRTSTYAFAYTDLRIFRKVEWRWLVIVRRIIVSVRIRITSILR